MGMPKWTDEVSNWFQAANAELTSVPNRTKDQWHGLLVSDLKLALKAVQKLTKDLGGFFVTVGGTHMVDPRLGELETSAIAFGRALSRLIGSNA